MKADLHIHTRFSYDGVSSPKNIIETALSRGINCVCITDHRTIQGAVEALRAGFDKNILVIPGIEVRTKLGDILGLNIKKLIPDGLSAQETIKKIREQGGMAIIAHPFAWPVRYFKGKGEEILTADGIEGFNASLLNFSNQQALNYAQKYNIPFTAGSDAHMADFVGTGYLEISKDISSENEVLEEIRKKRVKIRGNRISYLGIFKNHINLRRLTKPIFYPKEK